MSEKTENPGSQADHPTEETAQLFRIMPAYSSKDQQIVESLAETQMMAAMPRYPAVRPEERVQLFNEQTGLPNDYDGPTGTPLYRYSPTTGQRLLTADEQRLAEQETAGAPSAHPPIATHE